MPPSNAPAASSASRVRGVDRSARAPSTKTPGHVGHEDDPVGLEPHRERARGLVRVDVQRPDARSARRRGCGRRRGRPRSPAGRHGNGSPTSPSPAAGGPRARSRRRPAASRRAERGATLGADGAGATRGRPRAPPRRSRDARPRTRPAMPAPLELGADLRACAVDDDDLVARRVQLERATGGVPATAPPSLTTTRVTSCTPRSAGRSRSVRSEARYGGRARLRARGRGRSSTAAPPSFGSSPVGAPRSKTFVPSKATESRSGRAARSRRSTAPSRRPRARGPSSGRGRTRRS